MMAEHNPAPLDDPSPRRSALLRNPFRGDAFGRGAEGFARMMGTPAFLVGMTLFCAIWLTWNSLAPVSAQFDPRALNFTLLTLILSLQASYAAPLLLLAQNRQDDRDRVQAEQDRQSNDRNHATTDFITREIASLRLALNDVATRDFVRGELRDLLEDLESDQQGADGRDAVGGRGSRGPRGAAGPLDADSLRTILREEIDAVLSERERTGSVDAAEPSDTSDHPTELSTDLPKEQNTL